MVRWGGVRVGGSCRDVFEVVCTVYSGSGVVVVKCMIAVCLVWCAMGDKQ